MCAMSHLHLWLKVPLKCLNKFINRLNISFRNSPFHCKWGISMTLHAKDDIYQI